MNYEFAYAIGFHPWEDAEKDPPFVAKINELFDREELDREPSCCSRGHDGAGRSFAERTATRSKRPFPAGRSPTFEPSFSSSRSPWEMVMNPDEHWYRLRRE